MSVPDYPVDEAERLLALQRTQLLDSPAEERFDRITRLAARFFQVQTCLLSLVDSDRQWFKSRVGLEQRELGRDISFCGHAILDHQMLIVPDASCDARFAGNPLVTAEPYVRFYAGAPLRAAGGQVIGTLCLIDPVARAFPAEQQSALRDFADMIEREIVSADQAEYQRRLSASAARTASVIDTSPDIVFVLDRQYRFLTCNEHPDLLQPRQVMLNSTIAEVLPAELGAQVMAHVDTAFRSGEVVHHHYTLADCQQSFEARYRRIDDQEVLVVIRNTTEQRRTRTELKRLSEVARQTTNGVIVTDTKGEVVWINEAFSALSGYSLEDMLGQRPGDILQGDGTDPEAVKKMAAAIVQRESFSVDVLNYAKSGHTYWVRIACNPLWGDAGELKGYIAIQSDVSRERRDSEIIRSSESLLKAVIEANTIGTWRFNLQTGEMQVNDQWAALLGYTLAEVLPTDRSTWERFSHPQDLANCLAQLEQYALGLLPAYQANLRMRHKNGDWVWINARGRIVSSTPDGAAEWILGTHFDISAQMRAESSLREQSKQMQAIVNNMLDGVISLDARGIIRTFNRAAEQMFGYSAQEMLGRNVSLLMSSPHREAHDSYLADYVHNGAGNVIGRNRELEALHKDGTRFPIELGLAEVQQLEEISFIGIARDISQRKKREEEIRQLAFYDALTGLPNRRLLLDRLQRVIANCARHGRYAALLFMDMDNFKSLNDSAGHNKGDLLLCRVAERLVGCVRQGDTVSRLGGDEFVVVLEDLAPEKQLAANQAEVAAEKIIVALSRGFDLDGLSYNGSASIGVTMFNDGSCSFEDLLKQADMAMYKAKAAGRNDVHFFDPQMQIAVSLHAAMEQDLYDAIEYKEFQLYYQKQVDRHGRMTGAEILLRWAHPTKGVISPAEFIPLAEESGLIVPIGAWVLAEACRTLAQWAADPAKAELTISVNISVVQFRKNDLVKTVLDALDAAGAPPHRLKLEITETLLASNVEDVKSKMLELQRHGVSFSIDDFGTGYSSLLYLKQLPINQLKIDQSFVNDIINSGNDRAIAQAVITLAEAMQMNVIAEGVETEAQRALLLELGCAAYQGYLFGRPCLLEDLIH